MRPALLAIAAALVLAIAGAILVLLSALDGPAAHHAGSAACAGFKPETRLLCWRNRP
jgi:hypothetical protein